MLTAVIVAGCDTSIIACLALLVKTIGDALPVLGGRGRARTEVHGRSSGVLGSSSGMAVDVSSAENREGSEDAGDGGENHFDLCVGV